jgi:two-component system OmpR family sensor kinase
LKYAPNGGEVTLRIFSDEKSAIIEIIDNGQGIPVSEYERVFDAFYRIPGSLGEGSGLGLAIAKEAAIKLGGTLSLHARQKNSGLVVRYSQARQR